MRPDDSDKRNYVSPFFVLRIPLLGISHLDDLYGNLLSNERDYNEVIISLFNNPVLQEAIYLASPVLYAQLIKKLQGEAFEPKEAKRLAMSLLKYYTRACSRCTPFGLFATCSVGTISESTRIQVGDTLAISKHLRLDMDYLCALGKHLAEQPSIKEQLYYYPNSSLYRLKNKLRYVEYRYGKNNVRTHHLVSIDFGFHINLLLKKSRIGLTYQQLIELLQVHGIESNEAIDFIDELIKSQVLQSSLEANVTGKEYFDVMIATIEEIKDSSLYIIQVKNILVNVKNEIENIRSNNAAISSYTRIVELLKALNIPINEQKLFQLDSVRHVPVNSLDQKIVAEVQEALEALSVLNQLAKPGKTQLEIFKNAFSEKYETRAVRLVEVLDSEIGLGYKKAKSTPDFYEKNTFQESTLSHFKYKKYYECQSNGDFHIEITKDEIKAINGNWKPVLDDSFCTIINLVTDTKEPDQTRFELKVVAPAAANLLGRFCHADHSLNEKLLELVELEEKNHSMAVTAEMAHLPQSRIGNVLARPHLRKYEIPYLAQSTLPLNNRVALADLYIKIQNDKIVLISKRLKNEVLPRLSSAHNYVSNSLPIYNFLGDLQYQDKTIQTSWNWGKLSGEVFLPRVVYKNAILSCAQWNLKRSQVEGVIGTKIDNFRSDWFEKVSAKYKIPDRFYLVEGDNTLLLSSSVPYCIDLLRDKLKKGGVSLKEFLGTKSVGDGHEMVNEILIPFVKQADNAIVAAQSAIQQVTYFSTPIKRDFYPGSEWLYFKVYANETAFDFILTKLAPFVEIQSKKGAIDKWFFVRYSDPKKHIRVRCRVMDAKRSGDILHEFHSCLSALIEMGTVHEIKLDVYKREMERYGLLTMDLSEEIFSINSSLVCELLMGYGANKLALPKEIVAVYLIDKMMDACAFTIPDKMKFYEANLNGFLREFNVVNDKAMKLQLADLNRTRKREIDDLLAGRLLVSEDNSIQTLLKAYSVDFKSRIDKVLFILESHPINHPKVEQLLASYIHMFINRLLNKNQRRFELIIYSLLFNHHRSSVARLKQETQLNNSAHSLASSSI